MIRDARPEDATIVIPLVYQTIHGIAHTLSGEEDVAKTVIVLSEFFRLRANRLSYENTLVNVLDGEVAGIAIAYPGADGPKLDAPFITRQKAVYGHRRAIDIEADDDEYYLDTLAVGDRFQRRGIGSALIAAVEQKAREAGHHKMGLLVEVENRDARRLYERLGYVCDKTRFVSGYEMLHLAKQLT